MIELGYSNERQILYKSFWTGKSSFEELPKNNWLLFTITQDSDPEIYNRLSKKSIDNNVAYLCAVGQDCKLIHDIFDQNIISSKIDKGESIESPDDFESSPMTTWHYNFSEGVWFAIMAAHHPHIIIDQIICIDFTKEGVRKHLIHLIKKINNRWLPSDEENEEPIYDI